jgi:signal peptidase II
LVSCIGCDQATKTVAKSVLTQTGTISYFNDTIRFQLALNEGAFMSLGSNLAESTRRYLFSFGAGCLLSCLLMFVLFHKPSNIHNISSLSLVIGGGFGNLIDRIAFNGKVVDFMNIGVGSIRTGIFNVADIAITFGVVMLLVSSIRAQKDQAPI